MTKLSADFNMRSLQCISRLIIVGNQSLFDVLRFGPENGDCIGFREILEVNMREIIQVKDTEGGPTFKRNPYFNRRDIPRSTKRCMNNKVHLPS